MNYLSMINIDITIVFGKIVFRRKVIIGIKAVVRCPNCHSSGCFCHTSFQSDNHKGEKIKSGKTLIKENFVSK